MMPLILTQLLRLARLILVGPFQGQTTSDVLCASYELGLSLPAPLFS